MKQKTLKNSFSVSGKGLHTGLNITATFLPAPKITDTKYNASTLKDNRSSRH